jgi:hypothetical protein
MHPVILRKTAGAAAVVLPLLFVSCHRQAVEPKQPVVEQQKDSRAANQALPVGTSGTDTVPGEPAAAGVGTTAAPREPIATASDAAIERDPDAIKALEGMASYLRTLKAFQVRSETSREEVLDSGLNVDFGGTVDMIVDRPNRLRAEVISDKQHRMYFDDGKTFSVWARKVNYYATIPAPPTLRELADKLSDQYDLELPLADLFYWGDRKSTDEIVGAIDVGDSQVDGVTCEHYAFRQEGVDWQVWMQKGDYPLPRKLVITTTTDPARPKFTSVMTWNLAPSFNDAAFTFVPPKDAKRVMLAEAPTGDSQ